MPKHFWKIFISFPEKGDTFNLYLLSSQQPKPQWLFIYCNKWQRLAANTCSLEYWLKQLIDFKNSWQTIFFQSTNKITGYLLQLYFSIALYNGFILFNITLSFPWKTCCKQTLNYYYNAEPPNSTPFNRFHLEQLYNTRRSSEIQDTGILMLILHCLF